MSQGGSGAGRRNFLRGTVAAAPLAVLGMGGEAQAANSAGVEPATPTPTEPDYRPGFFSATEWAFINAACDRMIPKDEVGPGAVELGVPQYIDRQLQTPWADGAGSYRQGPFIEAEPEFGYQGKLVPREQYRLGIRAAEAHCQQAFQKSFADLPPEQQEQVLTGMDEGKIKSDDISLKSFMGMLLKNVREGYFCDPMYGGNKDMGAWKMIGYPGVRGDYMDWVDRRNQPYPYGPVSIHGAQG